MMTIRGVWSARFQLAAYIEYANVCGHGLCAGARES